MALSVQGQIGPTPTSDGYQQTLRLGRTGEQVVTELHGKYYEQSLRGGLFHATVATTGVAIAAVGTTAGIALYNPPSPGTTARYLSLVRVALGIVSGTFVVGTIMHGVNTNLNAAATTGTALTAIPGLVGASYKPVGQPFVTATLPVNPTALRPFAMKNAAPPFAIIAEDVDGQIVLAPGATWSLFVVGADTTPLEIVSVTWEEVLP